MTLKALMTWPISSLLLPRRGLKLRPAARASLASARRPSRLVSHMAMAPSTSDEARIPTKASAMFWSRISRRASSRKRRSIPALRRP